MGWSLLHPNPLFREPVHHRRVATSGIHFCWLLFLPAPMSKCYPCYGQGMGENAEPVVKLPDWVSRRETSVGRMADSQQGVRKVPIKHLTSAECRDRHSQLVAI